MKLYQKLAVAIGGVALSFSAVATHTTNFPQAATLIYSFALIPRPNATVPVTGRRETTG